MHTLSARDHREMDRLTPLLLAACRRDAPTTLAAADMRPLGEREVRARLLDLASRHGVQGLMLATLQRAGLIDELPKDAAEAFRGALRGLRRRAAILRMERDHVLRVLAGRGLDYGVCRRCRARLR